MTNSPTSKGLSTRDPLVAALMLVLMFSTAGVPPFIGFWAKLWIIQALLTTGHVWLAVFAVVISVVGAFYYLRVVWYMYFEAAGDRPVPERKPRMRLILLLNTLAVAALGLLPQCAIGYLPTAVFRTVRARSLNALMYRRPARCRMPALTGAGWSNLAARRAPLITRRSQVQILPPATTCPCDLKQGSGIRTGMFAHGLSSSPGSKLIGPNTCHAE